MAKREFKFLENREILEVVKIALANPAVIGTILFIAVGALKSHGTASPPPAGLAWIDNFIKRGLALDLLGMSQESTQNISIDALQAALLVYIATGGNPTGALSSLAGLTSKAFGGFTK